MFRCFFLLSFVCLLLSPLSVSGAAVADDDTFFLQLQQGIRDEVSREFPDSQEAQERAEDAEGITPKERILACLADMRRAYDAQMAFALYSLSIIREIDPEAYEETLDVYRSALRAQYAQDVESMSRRNMWYHITEASEEPTSAWDVVADAPLRNNHGIGIRTQKSERIGLRKDILKLKQAFICRQIQERTKATGYEYLTDRNYGEEDLDTVSDLAPTPYSIEMGKRFEAAENLWWKYATDSIENFYSPARRFAGTDTRQEAYMDLAFRLWEHHECFLAQLLGAFDETDSEEDSEEE